MGSSTLMKTIEQKSNGKFRALCLKSATLKKKEGKLVLVFLFPDGKALIDADKKEFIEIVKDIFKNEVEVEVVFKKSYVTEEIVKQSVEKYVSKNFASFLVCIKQYAKTSFDGDKFFVEIGIDKDMRELAENKKLCKKISTYLEDELCFEFVVSMKDIEIEVFEQNIEEQDEVEIQNEQIKRRVILVREIEKFIGNEILELPMYIMDIKTPMDGAIICGKIKNLTNKEITTKTGKTRHLVKFSLVDFTSEMQCVMFCSDSNFAKMEKLVDDVEIMVFGQVSDDPYAHGLSLMVKDVSLCFLPKTFEEQINFKHAKNKYEYIFPEKIQHNMQVALFDASQFEIPEFLKNKDFVVFDLETTGLNFLDSEIIEIGAVKISNGVICERFASFVKPTKKIPQEITKLTGITDDDVKDGVSCAEMLQDFYKFSEGCSLVAHNIDFDYGFINYYGRKNSYDFSIFDKFDTYRLTTKFVKGMKNYKLKTVCDYFGISLQNAHRAFNDAEACAEVFIKLAKFL